MASIWSIAARRLAASKNIKRLAVIYCQTYSLPIDTAFLNSEKKDDLAIVKHFEIAGQLLEDAMQRLGILDGGELPTQDEQPEVSEDAKPKRGRRPVSEA